MGNFLSRFKSLESTKETLARIHTEIEEIEDYKWITLRNQNHIIGLYIFGLAIVYAIIVITLYFYYMQRFKNKGLMAIILYIITFPILAYFMRNFLKSYYQHKLAVQEDRLHELKRNKRKILNEIMEKETYKVAKELIEKYDPSMLKDKTPPEHMNNSIRMNQSMNNSILRQRITPMNPSLNQTAMASLSGNNKMTPTMMHKPIQPSMLAVKDNQVKATPIPSSSMINRMAPSMNPPVLPFNPALIRRPQNLVRPICAQDRSIVEKFVDYLVGDGPNNRYGLICKFCYSHNGMALKEEFDYLNFRCCFCNNLNMARKQKPIAPTLISYENAKESSLSDETLNESIKKFKLDDDSTESNDNKIEEIENKLNETKINDGDNIESIIDDEMQVDDKKEGGDDQNELNKESEKQLKQQLDDLKLNE